MRLFILLMMVSLSVEAESNSARYQVCTGEFAFCGASSALPTGKTITVNTPTGTAQFNEAIAQCPVMNGPAIADVLGGNMKGSCEASAPNHVWSLFATYSQVPAQWATPAWSVTSVTPRIYISGSDSNFSQMFSFDCVKTRKVNNVQIADCFGPINENLRGDPVPAGTQMLTEAPVGSILPVSGPLP